MFTYALETNPSAWMAAVIVATMLVGPGRAEEGVPNFSPDNRTGWIAGDPNGPIPIGDDYLPQPPGAGPGPVVSDKDHPYIDNRVARLTGQQPNNRVADLSNPILQPWVRESAAQAQRARLIGAGVSNPEGEVLADRRSGLAALPGDPGLFPPDPEGGGPGLAGGPHGPPHLSDGQAFAEREALLVRRIDRPL